MSMQSSTHEIEIRTVTVTERLDALRAAELRKELDAAVAAGVHRLVVDLSHAEFVDSAGLAALAKGMKDCRNGGGDLRIVSPTHPDAVRVFELTRFDQVFTMGASVDDVVGSW